MLSRRAAVRALASIPVALTAVDLEAAWAAVGRARQPPQGYQPRFFTPHEWQTLRLLVDIIIPRDARSGSATDAGVPEFIDFVMAERENDAGRTAMRGGLAWLDAECRERFGKETFVAAAGAERRQLLDDIAWPERAPARLSHGVQFFNRLRDLTASGFWSSKMGVADLQYLGNAFVAEWHGCPPEQLRKLGLPTD